MTEPRPRASVRSRLRAALPLGAAVLVSACAADEAAVSRAVRTDSAGVAIVVNDSIDRPLAWRFEERFAVGGAEDGPEALFGLWGANIGVDAQDRIYVLDAGNHRVVVVDASGAIVRTLGAKGGGPGEIQFPGFLIVHPGGEVGVYDHSRGGMVRFAADGSLLPVERLDREEGGPPPDWMRPTTGGVVLSRTDYTEQARRSRLLVRRDSAEVELAAVERPQPPMHMFRSCGGRLGMRLPPLFEPAMAWGTRGGHVAAATSASYVVDVFDDGRLVRSIRRSLAPAPVTQEMARREVGEGMPVRFGGGECTIGPDEVIEVRGLAPVLPAVRSVAIAPDSMLWVERGRVKGDPPVIDLFAADGEYLGTLPPGSLMPAAFLSNGDVVSIATDDLDVQRVVVHRVLRDGTGSGMASR